MPNGPKFEHFDYQGNGTIVRLKNALTADGSDLCPEYDRNQLYCPFCHIARLSFVSKSTDMHGRVRKAHLVTKRASQYNPNNHTDRCDGAVSHDPVEANVEHYVELTNEQITDRLAAEARRYLRAHEDNPEVDMPGNDAPQAPPHVAAERILFTAHFHVEVSINSIMSKRIYMAFRFFFMEM